MRRHGILMGTAIVAAVVCLAWASRTREEAPADPTAVVPFGSPAQAPMGRPPPASPATRETLVSPRSLRAVAPPASPGSGEPPNFDVDSHGNLVLDGRTRQALERLLALNDPGEALGLLQQTATALPVGAYRQATDAFYAYQHYLIALRLAFQSEQPVTDDAEATRQFEALQALRVTHFGAETAHAYFGDEEATVRQWLADALVSHPADGTPLKRPEVVAGRRDADPAR